MEKVEIETDYYFEYTIETPYVNQQRHGIEKWFNTEEKLVSQVPYFQDEKHGVGVDSGLEVSGVYMHDSGETQFLLIAPKEFDFTTIPKLTREQWKKLK